MKKREKRISLYIFKLMSEQLELFCVNGEERRNIGDNFPAVSMNSVSCASVCVAPRCLCINVSYALIGRSLLKLVKALCCSFSFLK